MNVKIVSDSAKVHFDLGLIWAEVRWEFEDDNGDPVTLSMDVPMRDLQSSTFADIPDAATRRANEFLIAVTDELRRRNLV